MKAQGVDKGAPNVIALMLTVHRALIVACIAGHPAASQSPTPQAAAAGIVCRVVLDRTEAVAGEELRVEVILDNRTKLQVQVPANGLSDFGRIRLRCRTARGDVLRWLPNKGRTPRPGFRSGRKVIRIAPGGSSTVAKLSFRLSTNLMCWRPGGLDTVRPTTMRAPGEYLFWAEFLAPANPQPAKGVWSGHAIGETTRFKLLTKPVKPGRITPEMETDLQAYGLRNDWPAHKRLFGNFGRANEALVERMIALHRQDHRRWGRLWTLLGYYAGTRNLTGATVPGCTSPALARLTRGAVRDDSLTDAAWRTRDGMSILVSHLLLHPDDRAVRTVVEQRLLRSCKLDDRGPVQLSMAWQGLIDLGLLRDGMTVKATERILGKPTRRFETGLTWKVDSRRHVNPMLSVQLRDGKVYGFRIGRG